MPVVCEKSILIVMMQIASKKYKNSAMTRVHSLETCQKYDHKYK